MQNLDTPKTSAERGRNSAPHRLPFAILERRAHPEWAAKPAATCGTKEASTSRQAGTLIFSIKKKREKIAPNKAKKTPPYLKNYGMRGGKLNGPALDSPPHSTRPCPPPPPRTIPRWWGQRDGFWSNLTFRRAKQKGGWAGKTHLLAVGPAPGWRRRGRFHHVAPRDRTCRGDKRTAWRCQKGPILSKTKKTHPREGKYDEP